MARPVAPAPTIPTLTGLPAASRSRRAVSTFMVSPPTALDERPVEILLGDYRSDEGPLNVERRIIESQASDRAWRVEAGGQVVDLGVVLEGLVTMRAVLGDGEQATIRRAQLRAAPLAIGWGFGSEVDHHVEDSTFGASDQLRLEGGRLLEGQAANGAPSNSEAHVCLDRQEVEAMLCELPGTPSPHEPATIIFMRIRIDHPGTDRLGLRGTHAATGWGGAPG